MRAYLDNPAAMMKSDPEGMSAMLAGFGGQLEEALRMELDLESFSIGEIQNILICGMGGSAVGGDLLKSYLGTELKIPLYVNRSHTLPGFAGPSTLAVICSYSGETKETLSAFHEARKAKCSIICWTSNGCLQDLAKKHGLAHIKVPSGLPPRTSLAYSTIPLLRILAQKGLVSDRSDEIQDALEGVKKFIENYRLETPVEDNEAKQLALKVYGKIPLVYGSQDRLDAVANRWREQFAENSKQLSYSGALPEMNHNEIAGWKHPSSMLAQFIPIFLCDKDDHPEIQMRIELTKEVLSGKAEEVLECSSQGGNWMERLWSLILLGDYTSLYLAFLNMENPVPVEVINDFKSHLEHELKDSPKEWENGD